MSSSALARVAPQVRVTVPHAAPRYDGPAPVEAVLPSPSPAVAGEGEGPGARKGFSRKGSRHGLTHGLHSKEAVIRGEDPAAFEAYRADLLAEMRPVGTREADLLETMVMAQWKLRRLWRGETGACAKLCDSPYIKGQSQAHAILETFHGARRYASLTGHEAHLMRAYLRAESRLRLLQDLRCKRLVEEDEVEAESAGAAEQAAQRDPSQELAPAAANAQRGSKAQGNPPAPGTPAAQSTGWQDRKTGEITNQAVAEEMLRRNGPGSAGQGLPMAAD